MWHQYNGSATLSKAGLTVPRSLLAPGRTLWLVAERVHRQGTVFLTPGGKVGDTHIGYLSPLEVDLTAKLSMAGTGDVHVPLSIVVDQTKLDGVDGLVGEIDLTTDGTGLGGWGGIGGHVRLESRPRAWIANPFVQPSVARDLASATVNVTVDVGAPVPAPVPAGPYSLVVSYLDPVGAAVPSSAAGAQACTQGAATCHTADQEVQHPQLWDPAVPTKAGVTAQYTARVELRGAGGVLLDVAEVRFGFKLLSVEGYHFKLNGRFLYLHGYGDDRLVFVKLLQKLVFYYLLCTQCFYLFGPQNPKTLWPFNFIRFLVKHKVFPVLI